MIESKIEKRFKDQVRRRGGKAFKFISPGEAGMPDRIVILPGGVVVFAELKAPGKDLRPLQEFQVKQLRQMGVKVFKIDSEEAIQDFIREVFEDEERMFL